MSEVPLWLERKFSSEFPVDVYPNLRIRLRGTPARLEEMTGVLPRKQLTYRPGGKWSIQENAGHLLDLEPLWFNRLEEFLAGATRFPRTLKACLDESCDDNVRRTGYTASKKD